MILNPSGAVGGAHFLKKIFLIFFFELFTIHTSFLFFLLRIVFFTRARERQQYSPRTPRPPRVINIREKLQKREYRLGEKLQKRD